MPSKKQVRFSRISSVVVQVELVCLTVLWMREWAAALSCKAISSVLLGVVIAAWSGVGVLVLFWSGVGR